MRFFGLMLLGLSTGYISKNYGNSFDITLAFILAIFGALIALESIITSAIENAMKEDEDNA